MMTDVFGEEIAAHYEAWYETPQGREADREEKCLLRQLMAAFPGAQTVLEIGWGRKGGFEGGEAAALKTPLHIATNRRQEVTMIAFGPIPSRRLGRSLGVNHIPPKVCSYSCVYCQVGRTSSLRIRRRAFYDPARVAEAVRERVAQARAFGERVDFITFVPDGEPTLDIHLGQEIAMLRPQGIPIAVITNGSLLWREDVRADLLQADWVSVKVDAVRETAWRRTNRPSGRLRLPTVLEGILRFAAEFPGRLVTETMLVAGLNDEEAELEAVAEFLARLHPSTACIAVPTRPPAEEWVRPPSEETVTRAWAIFQDAVERVELLTGYEGDAFAFTGDAEADLLSITAVHPLREDAVAALLARSGADWGLVARLVAQGLLVEVEYRGHRFYRRGRA